MRTPLSRERWTTVEAVFVAAAELPPEERGTFVQSRCGADSELLEEVLSLLRYDTRPPEVEETLSRCAQSVLADEALEGTKLGSWMVEKELGRGGMSEVYVASRADGRFAKTVAIKVIKRGMDTGSVVERFHAERRILAGLDHPYIARLLDGGETGEGLPYIVMDYVEGVSIDRWCHEHDANLEQRCELVAKVCDAVGYAHRSLVIHRDLKPGNILVGADGNPRLLDFGIAKLLDHGAEAGGEEVPESGSARLPRSEDAETSAPDALTHGFMRPFTPEYASPEQLAGLPIGTATDVYSLGAVLYELLTGVRPRAGAPEPASAAARRAGKGARWSGRLRGDADAILQMALRTEPERRYLSVDQFAVDLRSYLKAMPVVARPDSLGYRASKFVRRNRFGVVAAAAIVLALAAGIVVSTWEAGRANTEAAAAKAVSDFLRDDLLGQASPNAQAGQGLQVRTLLDRAAVRIEGKFKGKPVVEADIRNTIGESYAALGLYAEAQRQYHSAWELRRGALGENNRDTLDALTSIAVLDRQQGKLDEAERLYERILPVQEARFGERDPATLLTMSNLSVVYSHQGKYERAEELIRKVLPIQRQVLGPEHLDTLRTMNNLGVVYSRLGRFGDAEQIYKQVLEIRRRVQGPEHPNTIFTANNLAVVYSRPGGNPEAAEKLYRETLEEQRRILGPDHPDTLLTMDNLGILWLTQPGKYAAAEQMLKESSEARGRVLGPTHADTLASRVYLGMAEILQTRYREAESELRSTCDAYSEAKLQVWERYSCAGMLGISLVGQKRLEEAEPLLLAGYRGLSEREASIPAASKRQIGRLAVWLSRLYREEGKTEAAEKWSRISTGTGPGDPQQ